MVRLPSTSSAEAVLAKAVEIAVFAPVGALEVARVELPKLAARGRQTVEQRVLVGRFIATLVAQQARQRVVETMRPGTGRTSESATRPAEAEPSTTSSTRTARDEPRPDHDDANRAESPAETRDEARVRLAIDHYESLSATQVIPLLAALDPDDLAAIETFERAHRNRRTVLGRIEQLRSR